MTSCRPHPVLSTPTMLRTARASVRAGVPTAPTAAFAVFAWRQHIPLFPPPLLVSRALGLYGGAPRILNVPGRPFGSRPTHPKTDLNFEELEALIAQSHDLPEKDYTLIDVREPDELKDGFIPTAKNLPLSSFQVGLQASEAEFEKTYGFKKPSKDEQVIFYCRSGKRSTMATELARSQGYIGVRNYPGSWLDYSEKAKK